MVVTYSHLHLIWIVQKWILIKSKVDWANPHMVGGLKWINLDWDVIINGWGFCHMTLNEIPRSAGAWGTPLLNDLHDFCTKTKNNKSNHHNMSCWIYCLKGVQFIKCQWCTTHTVRTNLFLSADMIKVDWWYVSHWSHTLIEIWDRGGFNLVQAQTGIYNSKTASDLLGHNLVLQSTILKRILAKTSVTWNYHICSNYLNIPIILNDILYYFICVMHKVQHVQTKTIHGLPCTNLSSRLYITNIRSAKQSTNCTQRMNYKVWINGQSLDCLVSLILRLYLNQKKESSHIHWKSCQPGLNISVSLCKKLSIDNYQCTRRQLHHWNGTRQKDFTSFAWLLLQGTLLPAFFVERKAFHPASNA